MGSLFSCSSKLPCCNLRFLSSLCGAEKYELIEMDTAILYLQFSKETFDEISLPEMQPLWYWMLQTDCSDNFAADSGSNCLPGEQCNNHVTFEKRTPGFFVSENTSFRYEVLQEVQTKIISQSNNF